MTKRAAIRWSATLFAGLLAGYAVQSIAFSDNSAVQGDDRGPAGAQEERVLKGVVDSETGIEWRIKSYTSASSGLCIDVEAIQHATPVGGTGSCYSSLSPSLKEAALGLPRSSALGSEEAVVDLGLLMVGDRSYLLASGVVSCDCTIRAHMPDGSVVANDATDRAFIVTLPVDTPTVADKNTPIVLDKSRAVVIDLISPTQQRVRSYSMPLPFG